MLKQLHIKNLAVIEALDLALLPGMTVLTGETGAGKSILIDALGLVLGARADSDIIRSNTKQAEITALFHIEEHAPVNALLQEQAIALEDDELFVRRIVSRDGRSRAYLNSTLVAAQVLRAVGEQLVDIHGQHAHQSLIRQAVQRSLLDEYGNYVGQLRAVSRHYQDWQRASNELIGLLGTEKEQHAQLNLLEYQVQELSELAPQADEYRSLEAEYKRLEYASQLLGTAQGALSTLSEEEHCLELRLNQLLQELQALQKIDPTLKSASELLETARIQLSEASAELRHYSDTIEPQPERLAEVGARLDKLHEIARKHHIPAQQLPEQWQILSEQLKSLLNSQQGLDELKARQARALDGYVRAAAALHEARCAAAVGMAQAISTQLKTLGMPDGQFQIQVTRQDGQRPQAHGDDRIEFLVSTNAGQPPGALRKVASGGELSRISLAIQVIAGHDKGIPTLIFDEVDAGIGGGVAEIVGKLLHRLARQRQVLCVTHLPQVASQADQHLQVEKSSTKKTTQTQVLALDEKERIEEIARMLGGITISKQSLEHAREMLKLHA